MLRMTRKDFAEWIKEYANLADLVDAIGDLSGSNRLTPVEIIEGVLELLNDEAFEQVKKMYVS
jgi:hypothetical protein